MTRCKSWIALFALLIVATALVSAVIPQRADAALSLRARLAYAKAELREKRARLAKANTLLSAALAAATLTAGEPPSSAPAPYPSPSGTSEATPTESPSATPTESPEATPSAYPTALPTEAPTALPEAEAAAAASVAPAPSIEELRRRVTVLRRSVRVWRGKVHRLSVRYTTQRRLAAWNRSGNWGAIIRVAARRYHVSASAIYRMMIYESSGNRYAGSMYKGLFQYYPSTWSGSWNPYRHLSIYDGKAQIFATCYAVSKGYGPRMWPVTYWMAR